jgi:predicted DCC family thiol-disulfide oxidoreductase YuxK
MSGKTIVLYDGVCGLCNRFIRFMLRIDRNDRFRFSPLQSGFAIELLNRHAVGTDLHSVVVIADYNRPAECAYQKSDAILFALREVGGIWQVSAVARVLPRFIRNAVYDLIARNRYRVFGRKEACPVPKPADRSKFVELLGDFESPKAGN